MHWFWHVAAINHWREIIREQALLYAQVRCGDTLTVGFIGDRWEDLFLREILDALGLSYTLTMLSDNRYEYEYPTLSLLWKHCLSHTEDTVGYFHTKAVTHPGDWVSLMWRWALTTEIVGCVNTVTALSEYDVAGYAWTEHNDPGTKHFRSNAWIARAAYIASLPDPYIYKKDTAHKYSRFGAGHERYPAEAWIGSKPDVRANSLCTVPGFRKGTDLHPQTRSFWCDNADHRAYYVQYMLGLYPHTA